MDDEKDALEAIYQEDFEATEGAWRIRLPDYGCTLKVQLDAQYPEKVGEEG